MKSQGLLVRWFLFAVPILFQFLFARVLLALLDFYDLSMFVLHESDLIGP